MNFIFLNYRDIREWLKIFEYKTSYDYDGEKQYFCFDDTEKGGIYTLMKYSNGIFTLHSKGENYCEDKEVEINEDELVRFIWKNRKVIHNEFKREGK
ncbi:hypothetical protein [Metabacillus bambusae]|uniref:Uncharacterized protein n=1 Tax=Metabacillus bambusae TaxID=2795218 RepID=A0ABS3N9U8_9BACI|nr:hypothetical protein [Metabacillus bambusae]MBO1515077.1 hypothetical protein [Metabacillus bambusae]